MEPYGPQAVHIFAGLDAAFAHPDRGGRQPGGEIERDLEPYRKCLEVAIIYPDRVAIQVQVKDPVELFGGMDFAKYVEFEGVCPGCQLAEFQIAQSRGDQEDGIGSVGAASRSWNSSTIKSFRRQGRSQDWEASSRLCKLP